MLGANASGAVRIVDRQHLIRRGPYSVVRNPIYSGIVLAVLGSASVRGTARSVVRAAAVAVASWQKGRMEEWVLLAELGHECAAYRRDVECLVPYVV